MKAINSITKLNILIFCQSVNINTSLWHHHNVVDDPSSLNSKNSARVQGLRTNGVARAMEIMPFMPYSYYILVAYTCLFIIIIIMLWPFIFTIMGYMYSLLVCIVIMCPDVIHYISSLLMLENRISLWAFCLARDIVWCSFQMMLSDLQLVQSLLHWILMFLPLPDLDLEYQSL